MAVMTDVREAAQNLIEYAIHRSMIGQDDRIWAYNTILECIGATGYHGAHLETETYIVFDKERTATQCPPFGLLPDADRG